MNSFFGTNGPDTITSGGNSETSYWGLGGDDIFTDIHISSSYIDFRIDGSYLFDGGLGIDRLIVPSNSYSDAGDLNYYFGEVDPITFQGYTHRYLDLEFSSSTGTYTPDAQALLREIEEYEGPEGTVGTLTLGALSWHAENAVQYADDSGITYASPWQYIPGRDMVTLANGNVVKLLIGSGTYEMFFTILDGDGNVVESAQQYGPALSGNTSGLQNYQQITALNDGGFMVVWSETNSADNDNKLYVQAFDADGTARNVPLAIYDNLTGTTRSVIDYSITALDDGRAAVVANLSISNYQRAYVVEADGSAASGVGSISDSQMRFNVIGTVAASDGFTMLTIDEISIGSGQTQDVIVATDFVENPSTGDLEQQASRTLYTLPIAPRNEVAEVTYTRLGSDDMAALWVSGSTSQLELLTEIGGVVSTSTVALPFDSTGSAYVSSVSVNEASDGGAWVVVQLYTDTTDPAAVANYAQVFLAKLDATGTMGSFTAVNDHAGGRFSGQRPVVTETDDGVLVWWNDTGEGNAWVSLRDATGYNEVTGSSAAEVLTGTAADDRLNGYEGDDTLVASDGLDRFIGGAGTDTLSLGALGARFVTLQDGYLTGAGNTGARAALIQIENVTGGTGADDITGDDDDNVLRGEGGNDSLDGLSGQDFLRGGDGDDDLDGGDGNDIVAGNDGDDVLRGGAGDDSLYGGRDDDVIAGNDGDDSIDGSTGEDRLFGGSGNDTMEGGGDADDMRGGSGSDVLRGEDGQDTLRGENGDDDMRGGDDNDLMAGNDGADIMRGENGDDRLFGSAGNDVLAGNDGADFLSGGADDDLLFGGTGEDTLDGGAGQDQLSGNAGADVFVFDAVSDSAHGTTTRDTITDFEAGVDMIDLSGFGGLTFVTSYSGSGNEVRYNDAIGRLYIDVDGGASDFSVDLDGTPALSAGDLIL